MRIGRSTNKMLIAETLPATNTTLLPEGLYLLVIFAAILFAAFSISHMNAITSFGNLGKSRENSSSKIQLTETPSTENIPDLHPLPSAALELSVLRSAYQVPASISSEESMGQNGESFSPNSLEDSENFVTKSRPILYDSTLVNYNSYRHKLIEETLQKQYGGGYAPGNVILNLIELNAADSSASVVLLKKYERNFSDDFKFDEGAVSLCKICDGGRSDAGISDPLDHFIPKNPRKPSTTEAQTETASVSEVSIAPKPSSIPSARPNTPTSCQRIVSNRPREVNRSGKSPFVTPIHSRNPLNPSLAQGRGGINLASNVLLIRDQVAPLTEQLYRRNDTRPDVVSRTHVEAEEYLNRIATRGKMEEPRIKSSLKKSRRRVINEGGKFFGDDENLENRRTGDRGKIRIPIRNDVRRLSTSKPALWNN